MTDVLTITVPIQGAYASVNQTGGDSFRGGRKSPAYKALFRAVQQSAEAEMRRTGWTKAECDCFALIVRYVPDRRRADAMNLAKCEWDALTEAGVWNDDELANPCLPMIRPDFGGPHRVSIVVVKLYGATSKEKERHVVVPNRPAADSLQADIDYRDREIQADLVPNPALDVASKKSPPKRRERLPEVGGKPVSWAEARKLIERTR